MDTNGDNPAVHDDMDDLKETDIVFECHECGKSLVIDYHGAGLSVPCPDCKTMLQVPIPEGMELSDLDNIETEDGVSMEYVEAIQSENETLRAENEAAMESMKKVVTELEELRIRRRSLERKQKDFAVTIRMINQQVNIIKNAVTQMQETLKDFTDKPPDDTQNLG